MGPKIAIGGLGTVVLLVLGLIFGRDLIPDWSEVANDPPANHVAKDEKTLVFTKKILGTTEAVWTREFQKWGKVYTPPHLELFSDKVHTGCGLAPAAVGPFYCPADQKVYIDPTFFDELETKLGGSKGEFSQAYVIAHEVGHHVQHLLGYGAKRSTLEEHDFSVRLELQADYLAGVWPITGRRCSTSSSRATWSPPSSRPMRLATIGYKSGPADSSTRRSSRTEPRLSGSGGSNRASRREMPASRLSTISLKSARRAICEGKVAAGSSGPIPFVREGEPGFASGLFLQHLGLYAYRRGFLLRLAKLPPEPLEECEKLEQRVVQSNKANRAA
jgi:hypothetical protein